MEISIVKNQNVIIMLSILRYYYNRKKLRSFNKQWRKLNKDNQTVPKNIFNPSKVRIGSKTYGSLEIFSWNAENEGLVIGKFCSIAQEVKFILGGNHDYLNLSTFPFRKKFLNENIPGLSKGPIIIGDDVWLGYGAFILSGTKIGQGAIIGAMSVVANDVPPYAIVAGNPARIIKYRFDERLIGKILSLNLYDKLDDTFILDNLQELEKKVTFEYLEKLTEYLRTKKQHFNSIH